MLYVFFFLPGIWSKILQKRVYRNDTIFAEINIIFSFSRMDNANFGHVSKYYLATSVVNIILCSSPIRQFAFTTYYTTIILLYF